MKHELLFADKNGEVLRASIFEPLLQILLPAFVENAEEIQISFSRAEPNHVLAAYTKNGKNFPLNIVAGFHPADVFVRLKIIAGMSIAKEQHQTGEVALRFDGRIVRTLVEIATERTEETIHLKPEGELKLTNG